MKETRTIWISAQRPLHSRLLKRISPFPYILRQRIFWREFFDLRLADRHALSCPQDKTRSLHVLSGHLTYPFSSQRLKARAVFRWIAQNISYDVKSYRSEKIAPQDPQTVLADRKAVCQGYSDLFTELTRLSGIASYTLTGKAKGRKGHEGHAWNGALIDRRCFLFDNTWASGGLTSSGHFVRNFTERFFQANPKSLIATHFPDQEAWQLLDPPFSYKEFCRGKRLRIKC